MTSVSFALTVVPESVRAVLAKSTDIQHVRALAPQCDAIAALIDCLASTHTATRAATLVALANVVETLADHAVDVSPFRALALSLELVARAADAILFVASEPTTTNASNSSNSSNSSSNSAEELRAQSAAASACVRLFAALTRSEAHAADAGGELILLHSMRMLAAHVWPICGALGAVLRVPINAAVFVCGEGVLMLGDAIAAPDADDSARYSALYELTVLSGRGERECDAICAAPDVLRACARLLVASDAAAGAVDVKMQKCVLRLLHNVVQCGEHEIDVVRCGAVDGLLRLLAQPQPVGSTLHVLPALILSSISTVVWLRARLLANPAAIESLVRLLAAPAAVVGASVPAAVRESAVAPRRAALALLVSVACAVNAREALLEYGIVHALRVALDAVDVRDSFLESHADIMNQTELRVLLARAVQHFELDMAVLDEGADEPFSIRPRQTNAFVRERIRHELLDSELKYLEMLSSAVEDYQVPLQRANVIGTDELQTLFSDIGIVLRVHQNWAPHLSDAVRSWPHHSRSLGGACRDLVHSLHVYYPYVNNFGRANALHERLVASNAAYRDVLAQCAQLRGTKGRTLMAHLLQPLQRVSRYVAALVEYLNYTPPSHAEYADVRGALTAMRDIANSLSEAKREYESISRVSDVQDQLVGTEQIIAPGRLYVAEGGVSRIDAGAAALGAARAYYIFLFSDALLCTKPARRGRYKWKVLIPLIEATLIAREPHAFEVRTKSVRVVFSTPDEETQQRWLDLLRNAMRDVRLATFAHALQTGSVSKEKLALH
jgi:hypothetical protein